ncbi:MAG: hypothetical protein GY800_06705 [Planctomycetes bacterium]|nr:hypothetical protein [Planctomycetota bacterium]
MQVKDKYFGGKSVQGEVGIEIELEGKNFPDSYRFTEATDNVWTWHNDGSLRGASAEIVLAKPIPRNMVTDALAVASDKFKDAGTKFKPSVRTGVHVHVNVREMTLEQTYIFMLMWLMFENPLVRYCGEDRQGNLFCLRSADAEAYLDALEQSIKTNDFKLLYTDGLRYSAMNPKALCQYGSLEFRCMKTPEDINDIVVWVSLLLKLKDASMNIKDPRELLEKISMEGGYEYAEEVFGDLLPVLGQQDWTAELYEGLRRIQPCVYSREWDQPELDDVVLETELPQTMVEAKKRKALTPREIVEYNI